MSVNEDNMKSRLFAIGIKALEDNGWTVSAGPNSRLASVRTMAKGDKSFAVSIRTSQSRWIAFPRSENGTGWDTLDEVEQVLAVTVDDPHAPAKAYVHLVDAVEMRARFAEGYEARVASGRTVNPRSPMWVPIYTEPNVKKPTHAGAGAGDANPAIAVVNLESADEAEAAVSNPSSAVSDGTQRDDKEGPLTIAEAKRRLALTLGVDPSSIRITVEA